MPTIRLSTALARAEAASQGRRCGVGGSPPPFIRAPSDASHSGHPGGPPHDGRVGLCTLTGFFMLPQVAR